jgi:hypothetical protein
LERAMRFELTTLTLAMTVSFQPPKPHLILEMTAKWQLG